MILSSKIQYVGAFMGVHETDGHGIFMKAGMDLPQGLP